MRKDLLLLCLCFLQVMAHSQVNLGFQWRWVKGDSTADQRGIYGSKGIAADSNKPAGSAGSVSWKDAAGNFWLLGGQGMYAYNNALWKYTPGTNQWTWVRGDSTQFSAGVYGTQGIEDPANEPGQRSNSLSWTDPSGNFWLFGGSGYAASTSGTLNDLWKYNPSTNAWTWVKGDSVAKIGNSYGTQGIASETNKPGARYSSATWTDAFGNLWLFGGRGYLNTGSPTLTNFNDLWKYNPATNQWTWIGGNNEGIGMAEYGTKGVPSSANIPGLRYGSAYWKDSIGNFWLFGGVQYFSTALVFNSFNDLWKYNPSTNEWTWVSGDNTTNKPGVYGTQGVADPSNKPGARHHSATWTDGHGNLWLFGGQFDHWSGNLDHTQDAYNDLWRYNIASDQWTWVKGSNLAERFGVYGTQNVASPTNQPGARADAVAWTDEAGNFWLFGGAGFAASALGGLNASTVGRLNDLWQLTSNHPLPITGIQVWARAEQAVVKINWQTIGEENTAHFVIERSSDGRIFSPLGSVAAAGNSLSSRTYAFIDGQPFLDVNYYRIKAVDRDQNFSYSSIVRITLQSLQHKVIVSPNPVIDVATINLTAITTAALQLYLYDSKGQLVNAKQMLVNTGTNSFTINMSKLPKGVYFVMLKFGEKAEQVQIIKQ